MIKNVIFDIGQVLMGWHPDLSVMFHESEARIVEDAIWKSGYWEGLDLGIESEESLFLKMYERAPEYEESIKYTLSHLSMISERKDYAIPWIRDLKERGYGVYFLSNYSDLLRRTVPQVLDFLSFMDGGVFSCDVGLLKPDDKIYKELCDKYGLEPSECLFIDDRQENVDAAISFGMQAFRFDGYEESYEAIMKRLGKNQSR